jgi:hypothetical protein
MGLQNFEGLMKRLLILFVLLFFASSASAQVTQRFAKVVITSTAVDALTVNGRVTAANLTVTNPIVGSVTGGAAKLTTPRLINGVAFDGSADITVAAQSGSVDASLLTGTTLAAGVVSSSLTSTGTLLNLTVTNPISGNVTGSAASLNPGRTINGVAFNGTGNITVPAAAGTLTGTALAAGVVSSSLTSLGSLSSLALTGAATTTLSGLNSVSTDGAVLVNSTNATLAVPQQISPRLRFSGSAWKSAATAAAQRDELAVEWRPNTGTNATTGDFVFSQSLNGGAFADKIIFRTINATQNELLMGVDQGNGGGVRIRQSSNGLQLLNLTSGEGLILSAGAVIGQNNGFYVGDEGGVQNLALSANRTAAWTSGNSLSGGFDVGLARCGAGLLCVTDGLGSTTMKTLNVLGLQASGVAGASCTLTTVAHLTVVNGVVTLCN